MNQSDFIAGKRIAGATILETIKAVMREYGLSLGDAKAVVSRHPAWATIVDAAKPLHRDLDCPSEENSEKRKFRAKPPN